VLRRLFTSEKTPFFLAFIIASLAWCVSRIADRAVALPVIEYGEVGTGNLIQPVATFRLCKASLGAKPHVFLIRNISKDTAFANLNFDFYAKTGGLVREARWLDRPPGLAEQASKPCNEEEAGHLFGLQLRELQPGWSGFALVWSQTDASPSLMYKLGAAAQEKLGESAAPLLMEAGLTTWIIRNEFGLYYGMIIALIVGTILYVVSYVYWS
jgi:hypothetical protein